MRLPSLVLIATLIAGCDTQALVDHAVSEVIRESSHTLAEPTVRGDLETFATSEQMQRIVTDLTRAVIAAAEGQVDEAAIERGLRALIATALDEMRHDLAFVSPDVEAGYVRVMHDVDAMLAHLVSRTMSQVRGMVHGDDITAWVQDLLGHVLGSVIGIVSAQLDDDAAAHLGRFVRVAFREVLQDVDVAAESSRVAQAAAHGAGDGFGESLDGRLGKAIDHATDRMTGRMSSALSDAAGPWRTVAIGLTVALSLFLFVIGFGAQLLWRIRTQLHATQSDHEKTILELQHGAEAHKSAGEVLGAVRSRDVKLHEKKDPAA